MDAFKLEKFVRFVLLVILSLSGFYTSLQANHYPLSDKGSFTEWHQKHLDLISLFLPPDPVIVQAGGHYASDVSFAQRWPCCKILSFEPTSERLDQWCFENQIEPIDFLCLNLEGAELLILKSSPKVLKSVRCLAIHTNLFATAQYADLKNFLEESGFQLLTHWYEGLESDAIFVKRGYFLNETIHEFLNTHEIDGTYQRSYEPFFKTYYDLDDDVGDSVKQTLKQGYAYEGNIGMILEDLTVPGSLVLDIGSHIGVHTVNMSRKAGPHGAVMAFEPNKKIYMELLNTLRINQCDNVIPIAKGLSDRPQTVTLNNIRIEQDVNECVSGDLIETIALDSLNLNNLSLIKMDVENYEYFVLQGAKDTILRNKPVIVFECWIGADYKNSEPQKKANFDRVISLIESYGYEIHVIYCNDFIAFPLETTDQLAEYKEKFKKLDLDNFDLGL